MADTRIDELRRRLDRDPGSRLFAQLAEELRKSGELAEAASVARGGLALHPAYASARLTLGRALLDSGAAAEGRVELESVLREAPDNIQASRYLAQARDQLGDLAGAAAQYRKTLLMAPGDRQLQAALAEVEARLKGLGGSPGAGAETTPTVARRSPPPLPAAAGAGEPSLERAGAPPVVFAPSRPARAAEPASEEPGEGGALPPTLRIHASQVATPQPSAPPPPPPPPAYRERPAAAEAPPPEPEPRTLPGAAPEAAAEAVEAQRDATPPPEAATDGGAAAGSSGSATPFSSSTLAELYFQQGLVERAADVYRQLLEQEPGNEKARLRLVELESAEPVANDRAERRRALERTIAGLEGLLGAVRRR